MKIIIRESQLKGDFEINYSFKDEMGEAQIYYRNTSEKAAVKWMGYDNIEEVDDPDDLKWIKKHARENYSPRILLLSWRATKQKSGFSNYAFQKIFDIAEKHNCYLLEIWEPNQITQHIMKYFTKNGYVKPDTRYEGGISVARYHYIYWLLKRPPINIKEGLKLIRGEGNNATGNVDLFGKGLYLTDDVEVARFYGKNIKQFDISGKIFDITKNFAPIEFKKFCLTLNKVFNTDFGTKYLNEVIGYNDGKLPRDIDYTSISWALNSKYDFDQLIGAFGLNDNNFNTYANTNTAINLVLKEMGYVGLKYSTSEIDDLDDNGLGGKNAYVVFEKSAIKID